MKRMRPFALMILFCLLVLGSTRAFAGSGGNGGNQGGNNQGGNDGGLIGWIENLIKDIFDDGNNQGNNQGNNGDPGTTSGGGTAPIDGGICLLLVAGVGLGMKKVVRAPRPL
jgi:hypothetical protein